MREVPWGWRVQAPLERLVRLPLGSPVQHALPEGIGSRAPPGRRALAHKASNQPGQMRLVSHSTFGGDVTEGFVGREHEALRPLDATPDDVLVGRLADALAECNRKVERAKTSESGELIVLYRIAQVCIDVCDHSAHLPRGKTMTRNRHRWLKCLTLLGIEHRLDTLEASGSASSLVSEGVVQCAGQLEEGRSKLME